MQTQFNMKLITTEKEYNKALQRLDEIFDAKPKTKKGQEAELLALLIEEYEEKYYKIEAPDPITAIRIRMEEMEMKQKDLVGIIGSKGIVSEVLNKKRKLTVNMIRNLSNKLKIAAQILIQEYELNR
ncbi:MAG: transcriptional regulator [Saprospiraceae bacterium]|nr:transcriptional regulator [Saprospiraceae bacterium]